jgi:hypothetical protein
MSKNQYLAMGLVALCIVGGVSALTLLNSTSASSQMNHESHQGASMSLGSNTPTLIGQDAFGATQEIVGILEADSATDWSQVNLTALRKHLIDMNEVTLNAVVEERKVDSGLEMQVTGIGRTQEAIQRLVFNQAKELNQLKGWQATTTSLPGGITLTVIGDSAPQVERIRALGFAGLLVSGNHHREHHLALARGMMSY